MIVLVVTWNWRVIKVHREQYHTPSDCLKGSEVSPSEAESLMEEVGGVEKGVTQYKY